VLGGQPAVGARPSEARARVFHTRVVATSAWSDHVGELRLMSCPILLMVSPYKVWEVQMRPPHHPYRLGLKGERGKGVGAL
jgi:hypothetical protein